MNTNRSWKIILTLAAIVFVSFSSGFLAGSKTKQVEMRQRFDPSRWNVYAMKTLNEKLDLTAEQQERIQAIIDQTVDDMKFVHQDTVQKTSQLVDELLASIDQELTPQQRTVAETLSPSSEEVTIDLLKVGPDTD
jgi:hypothetical protein